MNYRQMGILRDLMLADDFLTGKRLAAAYSVSTKTIYSDLVVLDYFLQTYHLSIERTPRLGIRLHTSQEQKLQLLQQLEYLEQEQQLTAESRQQLLLKALILEHQEIEILNWSLSHFISETSTRRDIEHLEKMLQEDGLQLIRYHGKLSLEGEERTVRQFLRNYLLHQGLTTQEQLKTSVFFRQEEVEFCCQQIENISQLYQFKLNPNYQIYLIIDVLIAIHRYRKGCHIQQEEDRLSKDLSYYEVYMFSGELLSALLKTPIENIAVSEIISTSYALLSVGYELNIQAYQGEIREAVSTFIQQVSRLSDIDLRQDHYLFQMLLSHIQPMIFRLKNHVTIKNVITEEIKKKYSVLYHIVWLASKVLAEAFELKLTDSEIAFLTIHFEIAIEKLAHPLLIYVVCSHGLATSELVVNSLRRIISSFDDVRTIDLEELTEEKKIEADLIISSILIADTPKDKTIFISPILTDAELEMIQKSYAKLTKGNRQMLSIIENHQLFHQTLIPELLGDNVYLRKSCATVKDCIAYLAEQSSIANRSQTDYLQSILDREKLGSTSVYTGIALPHANPKVVQESQLLLMTLKKPIKWGENMIKVVMLIAMAEKDEYLYKEALISLYAKIDSKDFVEKLWQARSAKDFKKQLLEGGVYHL